MDHLDLLVISQAKKWAAESRSLWLCTVLTTYGSAPRSPGAMLVALPNGENRGSLSGGCIEEDFLERLTNGELEPINQIIRYGDGGLPSGKSLPCGGVLDILVEHFAGGPEVLSHFAILEKGLLGSYSCVRVVLLKGLVRQVERCRSDGPRIDQQGDRVFIRLGAVRRLIVAGMSPVAEYCASFAIALGYEVIICEPREEYLKNFSLPNVQLVAQLPALYISEFGCHESTAVVALTHDPKFDDLTMIEAVRTKAFYIGAMGSAKSSVKRKERLKRLGGLGDDDLSRIQAPIGLNLDSKTPAEIALAVMADIVRTANGVGRNDL
ncbi:xanthine dehydrogenase accessory factor [Pseudomonas syringae]|nr:MULTISPECIES: XdhC family protein [Pseudomonas syringae group]RMN56906.1 hypothetical protein ALQ58_200140 [Pseudomonas syringae pv. apii]SDZ51460.1 xanthine dehydrogenase accessory factor [Pseudomonas syringae]